MTDKTIQKNTEKPEESTTDIFSDLAGSNEQLQKGVSHMSALWQRGANKRTKIVLMIGIILGLVFYVSAVRPPADFPVNTLILVEKGQGLNTIAQSLQEQGVVRSGVAARFIAKIYGVEKGIQSGDYLFKQPVNIFTVIKRMSTGIFGLDPVTIRVTDGQSVAQIAKTLEKKMMRFDSEKFLAIAGKHEGYLFPDTYYFLPNATEKQLVGAMVDNFENHYAEVAEAAKKTGLSKHEVVTLASLVQLEAWKYDDQRKIAGVLYNRLAINMPLQVDVSFVYIMNKGSFEVTRADMRHQSPYNTYVHKGLPPGPIGSPSLAALKATVYPEGRENNWIFYLADSSGTTHFSKTYAQHLVKKRKYIDNR